MKAIISSRVSTEEQKDAGNSLPAQTNRLKKYCKRKNFTIVKEFSFDESAYKTKRDDFDLIIEYIKNSKNKIAVCFDKVDRFSRNVFDKRVPKLYDLAMDDKIELHFVSDNLIINSSISATEKFQFGISLGLAKYYSDAISDNVKRAYEIKIKKGEWIGKAPLGYMNVEDENGKRNIIIDPVKSTLAKKMFEMYSTGSYSMRQIANEMKKLGLRSNTKNPRPIAISMINNIFNNPFYYGQMKVKDKLYPHKYQPLISKDLFDKVQQIKAEWHKKPFKYASKPFIFRGLLKCDTCGCTITPEKKKGFVYYSCTNYKKAHKRRTYVREEEILTPIKELLKNIQLSDEKVNFITKELKKANESKNKYNQKSVSLLKKEHELIEGRISNMMDARFDGSITTDMFNQKLKEYKERQQELLEKIDAHDKADEGFLITVNTVLSLAQRALELFESSEIAEKRQLLNFLLQNATLNEKTLQYKLKAPFDTVLEANNCSDLLPGSDSNRRPID